ncbi:NADP-dependent oxidoreductase [Longispora sp. NPDC051575]|uniref:NADP-dependent oxidoreductase n=1 Tax=Longispora sp. NPDC051575 TaxID=3154943 RepID=UPI0034157595
MRAIQSDSYGPPDVLHLVDLPVPVPGLSEVLVRVAAAGLNPTDLGSRAGESAEFYGPGPHVWGWDISGTVVAVGPGVASWRVGDEVYGMPRFPAPAHGYAEYVAAPAHQLAAKPAGLDHAHAAGLPLAGLTALQLLDLTGVSAGHRVLVNAAAGGVGHLAVQLAKARGAYVLGTARAVNHGFLRSLGVDVPVDYTVPGALDGLDADVVLDAAGAEGALAAVRDGGVFGWLHVAVSEELAAAARARDVRIAAHLVHPDGHGLARLGALVDAGALRVELAEVFPLAEAARAHATLATGRVRGKLVLAL